MMFAITTDKQQSIQADFMTFPSGERHVQLRDEAQTSWQAILQNAHAVQIKASIHGSDDVMDLLLLENTLRSAQPNIEIDLILPYLPYARQDRVCAVGQAFSMQVMARLLQTEPKKSIKVWDCHSAVGLQLTGAINVSPAELIAHSSELVGKIQANNAVLICPDKGAIQRTQAIAEHFAQPHIVYAKKIRNPVTGQITHSEIQTDNLSAHTAVIVDDICDGGATFINLAKALRDKGCQHIVLYVTHGIFSRGISVFEGLVDEIYTTNSFEQKSHPKLNVIHIQ